MRDNARELYGNPTRQRFDNRESESTERKFTPQKGRFGVPILILVPFNYADHILDRNVNFLERVKDMTKVHYIKMDPNLNFSDLSCSVVYINDLNEQARYRACRKVIDHFLIKHMKFDPKDERLSLSILIPESQCSMFIGKEGKNIKGIMNKTSTQLDLHTRVYENGQRPVDIKGNIDNIIYAVEQINECLNHFQELKPYDKGQQLQLPNTKEILSKITTVYYVFNEQIIDELKRQEKMVKNFNLKYEILSDNFDIKEI